MFIGKQNGKVMFIAETKEELEKLPCVILDSIEETNENWQFVNGDYRIDGKKTEEELREERDALLIETDKYMLQDFPITQEEKEKYKEYREYLRQIPQQNNFPNIQIKTFLEYTSNN